MSKRRANQRQTAEAGARTTRVVAWSVVGLIIIIAAWRVSTSLRPPAAPVEQPPPGERPNVLLISIDMLRPDHLHCYGYERSTSPRLDRIAQEGVLFENHISSTSWTLPAHAALFTSLADSVHGCTDTDKRLPDKLTTLAEHFSAAGYQTVGFSPAPISIRRSASGRASSSTRTAHHTPGPSTRSRPHSGPSTPT